jgi:hypothetical protein
MLAGCRELPGRRIFIEIFFGADNFDRDEGHKIP